MRMHGRVWVSHARPNPRTETSILGIPRNPNSLIYNHQISHCDQETMTRHAEPDGADIKG